MKNQGKNMRHLVLSALLGLTSLGAAAQPAADMAQLAQRLEGTIYVIPHRESADGSLTACGLEFGALKRDFSTMKGAPVKLVGSFYLRPHTTTGLAYMLKVGAFDGFGSTNGFAPANAFIRGPNSRAPKKAIRLEAENKGYALFVGSLDDEVIAAFAGIAEKKQLVVGFNRKPGQQDVIFNLDLTVIDTKMGSDGQPIRNRTNAAVDEFLTCSEDLMKTPDAKLK
ncbi:hypothetical protein B472_12665 [Limnohabitans sp. Rim28]|nr:hypothetical protein B472_12665 [Limnohabitans sp. Rim28]